MANQHGEFIWYELMTRDPEAARGFYEEVVGWNIAAPPASGLDYRIIEAAEGEVGGLMTLSDEMCEHGARPGWLGYVGVEDVDATLERVAALGGKILMPAWDIPDVGRLSMVADPQGNPFYIMRGAVEGGTSRAFNHKAMGHCAWNELTTADQEGALAFYGELFGWKHKDSMPMGELGDYKFLHLGEDMIGAVSPPVGEGPVESWTYYFHVPNIDVAVEKTRAQGGQVQHGPHEIPGGGFIVIGSDPEGATFALVELALKWLFRR